MTHPPVETAPPAVRLMVRNWQSLGQSVGVVPTMGALHEGHLSLVAAARDECDKVAVTIFVNPTQFAPGEDFTKYPRTFDHDLALLAEFTPDVVFAPTAASIYPDGFATSVDVGPVARGFEGASRPTHFAGVATVVLKLLNIVPGDVVYFGQKDYQQTVVVRRMMADLNLPGIVRICPTVREADGLAMSSRNTYLTPVQREAALVLSRSLRLAEQMYVTGERGSEKILAAIREQFTSEPLAKLDYVAMFAAGTMDEIAHIDTRAVVALAAKVGETRLIDNTHLGDDLSM